MAKVTVQFIPGVEKRLSNIDPGEVGIITKVPTCSTGVEVGDAVVGAWNEASFPRTNLWTNKTAGYFYRPLAKGESVIIEG